MSRLPRVLHTLAFFTVAVLSHSCQLDQLFQPEPTSSLVVNPPAVADSAPVGSTEMRQRSINVSGDAIPGRSWRASISGGSGWLDITPSADTVPSSVGVSLKPTGLSLGSYEDTILVSSDMGDSPVRVPVRFLVQAGPTPPPPPPPQGTPQLVITVQPSSGTVGKAIAPPVVVVAQDAAGHLLSDFKGSVTMALGSNSGGAVLGGTPSVTASSGVATFSNLTLSRRGTAYTLVAAAPGFTAVESKPFNMAAPTVSASRSTLTVSPNTIVASTGSSAATVTVTAIDEQGNPVAGTPVSVSASGGENRIEPPTGTTDASGLMTAMLSSTRAEAKTVTAAIGGVTLNTTASVTVVPTAAGRLSFTVQPADVREGDVIRPPIQVSALDAFGNFAPDFNGLVTLTLTRGRDDATLLGTLTVGAVAGVATFDNVGVSRDGNNYAVTASADGLGSIESSTFRVRND